MKQQTQVFLDTTWSKATKICMSTASLRDAFLSERGVVSANSARQAKFQNGVVRRRKRNRCHGASQKKTKPKANPFSLHWRTAITRASKVHIKAVISLPERYIYIKKDTTRGAKSSCCECRSAPTKHFVKEKDTVSRARLFDVGLNFAVKTTRRSRRLPVAKQKSSPGPI